MANSNPIRNRMKAPSSGQPVQLRAIQRPGDQNAPGPGSPALSIHPPTPSHDKRPLDSATQWDAKIMRDGRKADVDNRCVQRCHKDANGKNSEHYPFIGLLLLISFTGDSVPFYKTRFIVSLYARGTGR